MAKLKLSELPQATSSNPNDLLYIVQSNTSKAITTQALLQNTFDVSLKGNVTFGGTPQIVSSPAVIDLSTPITYLRVQGATQDISIPNGANGQIKVFITQTSGGGTFALRGNISGSGLNFSAVGDDAILVYSGNAWFVVGQTAFRSANSYVSSVNGKGPGEVVLTTDDIAEGNNLYFSQSYLTTSNVVEGTNLYFTEQRAANVAFGVVSQSIISITTNDITESLGRVFYTRALGLKAYDGPLTNASQVPNIPPSYYDAGNAVPALQVPIHTDETANNLIEFVHAQTNPILNLQYGALGSLIYNSNIGKLQVYIGNTWANIALET
jgi:hypothetical protein